MTTPPPPVGEPEEHVEPAEPEDILGRRPDLRTLANVGVLVLGLFYTLYFAKALILPVVLGILLSFVLAPMVDGLERIKIPRALGAAIVLLGLLGGSAYGVYRLAGPAGEWIEQAPRNLREVQQKLGRLRKPVEEVERATEEVEKLAQGRTTEADGTPEVEVREPGFGETLVAQTRQFLATGALVLVLLYFLLTSGDTFSRKLAKVLPTFREKRRAISVLKEVRSEISTYLLTLSMINLGLGTAVWAAMSLLEMPNPVLWGTMAGLLNFVPYLGPLVGIIVVGIVSLSTFEGLGVALLPPAAYWLLNTLEGSLVTPMVMGRSLALNPVAVFLGLLFWGWIWGIPGALMAVPLVAILRIVSDHYRPLTPLAEFLAR